MKTNFAAICQSTRLYEILENQSPVWIDIVDPEVEEINFISTESLFLIPLSGHALFAMIVGMMSIIVISMLWYFRRQGWLG